MAITVSLIFMPCWDRLRDHLHIDIYDRDGGHEDPRIRIGFVDLPESFARELVRLEMPCVACERPIHPLRRRIGDGWDRLYYAPTCSVVARVACSRSRAAELEYERFKGIGSSRPLSSQLSLFG